MSKFRLNMKQLYTWILDIPCSKLEIQIFLSHNIAHLKLKRTINELRKHVYTKCTF